MRITLFIAALLAFFLTIALAVFIEPKSAAAAGAGFTVPFWPFVLVLALMLMVLAILFPNLAELIRLWLKTRVEIARAEKGTDNDSPPSPPPGAQ